MEKLKEERNLAFSCAKKTSPVGEASAKILLCYQEFDLPSLNRELHLR